MALPLVVFSRINNGAVPLRVILLFVVIGTLMLWKTHRRGRMIIGPSEGLTTIVARVGLSVVVTSVLLGLTRLNSLQDLNPKAFIDVIGLFQILIFTVPLILVGRLVSFRLFARSRAQGYDLEDTLIVGSGPDRRRASRPRSPDNPQFGLVPCGFLDRFDDELPLPIVSRPEHLPEVLTMTGIRHVVLAFGAASEAELVGIIRRCSAIDVQFYAVPRLFELGVSAEFVGHEVDGLPLVPVRRPGAQSQLWPAKRAFDIFASSVLLVLTSPSSWPAPSRCKTSGRGPIFFRQVRIGVGGRPFEILKFRTMRVNDDSATQWSVDDDERITRAGHFLRPSHLDELPQLLNVLKGEMSLVGPRPERPHFVEQFGAEIDGYNNRHRVPAGITGWAQVNGYWGDTSIETRVRLDNRYIENWSLWRDLVIGLRTIPTLLGKRR